MTHSNIKNKQLCGWSRKKVDRFITNSTVPYRTKRTYGRKFSTADISTNCTYVCIWLIDQLSREYCSRKNGVYSLINDILLIRTMASIYLRYNNCF